MKSIKHYSRKTKVTVTIIIVALFILSSISQHLVNNSLSSPEYTIKTIDLNLDTHEGFTLSTHILDFDWYENKLSVLLSNWTILLLNQELNIINRFHNNPADFIQWLDHENILLSGPSMISILDTSNGNINTLINTTNRILRVYLTEGYNRLSVVYNNWTISIYSIASEATTISRFHFDFEISDACWSYNSEYFFVADYNGAIYKWSNSSTLEKIFTLENESSKIEQVQCHLSDDIIMIYSKYQRDEHRGYSLDYRRNKVINTLDVDLGKIEWTAFGKYTISASSSRGIVFYDLDQNIQLFNVTVDGRIRDKITKDNVLLVYTDDQIIHMWEFTLGYTILFSIRDYRLSYLFILLVIPIYLVKRKNLDIEISTYPSV